MRRLKSLLSPRTDGQPFDNSVQESQQPSQIDKEVNQN
jgi:hypothetical protein